MSPFHRFRLSGELPLILGLMLCVSIGFLGYAQADTTTTLSSNVNPSVFGQTFQLTATVASDPPGSPETPSGTVTFYDGVTILGTADLSATSPYQAILDVSTLSVGMHDITAVYPGDADTNPSTSDPLFQTVNRASTSTYILGDIPDPSVLGQSYLVSGTVVTTVDPSIGTPTGTVTVGDGEGNSCVADVDPVTGDWSCGLSATSGSTTAGGKTLTANYSGDGSFTSSSDVESHTYTNPGTRTEVMGADTPVIVNNTATFTIEVIDTSADPTIPAGTVDLSVSPSGVGTLSATSCTLDAAGQCTFTYTPTSGDPTPHAVTAVYVPSSAHDSSTGTYIQEIAKRAADIALNCAPVTAYINQTVTCMIQVEDDSTAPVPEIPQGTVIFDDGGKNGVFSNDAPTLDANGCCTVTYTPGVWDEGTTTITASYSGSSVHTPKSANQLLTVELRPVGITMEGPTEALIVYEPGSFTTEVADAAGVDGATPPLGVITVSFHLPAGDSETTPPAGPVIDGSTSTWSFDYTCIGIDTDGEYDILYTKYEANDGIHADGGVAYIQAITRRPTETTLSDCACTPDGVMCTVTVADHSDNSGKGTPPSLPQGDFIALADEDEDGTFEDTDVGDAPTAGFTLISHLPMTNVTVAYEPSDRIYLKSSSSENVDRKDCMPPPDPGDGTTGAVCSDGCGSGGTNITELLYGLRASVTSLQAVSFAWRLADILTKPVPDPIAGVCVLGVVTGATVPVKGLKSYVIGMIRYAIDVYIYTVTHDTDADGLPDVVEQNTTDTDFQKKDTDGDGLTDSTEIAIAGGYCGGNRRPDPLDADTDGDGLKDGEEWYTYDTNPCVADTDCDTLGDGDEVDTWSEGDLRLHVDPLKQDTDSDGISDYIEYHVTHSPCPFGNDPDSDGDGLIDGYEDENLDGCWGDHDPAKAPWEAGYCIGGITVGGSASQASNTIGWWETNLCDPDTDQDGLSDGEEEGLFAAGEVTPKDVSTTVGVEGANLGVTVPALDSDMDNDGLSDYDEVNIYQTDPMDADTDDDTVSDYDEVATWAYADSRDHSNPREDDTDGDGLTDDVEIAEGCPHVNDDDSDDDGLQDGTESWNGDGTITTGTIGNSTTQADTVPTTGETDFCNPDTDGDGLADGEEVALLGGLPVDLTTGFAPVIPQGVSTVFGSDGAAITATVPALDDDSDNDGLSDYEEINITHTDPLDADTDNDTLSDANELIATGGTWPNRTFSQESDPLDPDTDDDDLHDYIEYPGSGLGTSRGLGGTPDNVCPYVNNDDSDDDGLQDGTEDANHDGTWGVAGAGITVGSFGTQAGSTVTYWETDLCNPDTDGDGLLDGEEVALIGGGPIPGRPTRPVPGFYTVTPEGVSTVVPMGTNAVPSGYTHTAPSPGTGNNLIAPYIFVPVSGASIAVTIPALDVDSDNDGLSDYEEVNITGTDPLDQDSDNDTLMDSDELIATGGTPGATPRRTFDQESDPLDINTDDDHLFDPQEYVVQGQVGSGLSQLVGATGGIRDLVCPFVNDDDSDYDGIQDGAVVTITPAGVITSLGVQFTYTHYEDFIDVDVADVAHPGVMRTVPTHGDGEQQDDTFWDVCDPDSDGDGLNDGEEIAIGTDPDDWDTDDDGRNDWHEVTGGGPIPTDPFDPDTDDDGLLDSAEVFGLNNTNPTNADTDGDGLCDGGTGTPWMTSGDARVVVNPICKSCNTPGLTSCGTLTRGGSADGIGDHPNPHGYGEDKNGNGAWDGMIGQLWQSGNPGAPETDPNQYDTDGDADGDGIEVLGFSTSRQGWIPTTDLFGRTINVTYPACGCLEPLIADTDGDGLEDGYEDNNHDGNFDFLPSDFDYAPDPLPGPPQPNPNETNPCDPDTDDDDLTDYEERYQAQVFEFYANWDNDGDGLYNEDPVDGIDNDGDGLIDEDPVEPPFNPTNPLDHDTDNDRLLDGFEVKYTCVALTYSQLDNDGDALIDEDPIDGLDNDGDGLFDEDPVDFFVRFVPMLDPTCRDSDSDGWIDGLDDDPCNSELIPLLPEVQIEPIDRDGDGFADDDEIMAGTHPNDPEDYPAAYCKLDLDFDQAIDDRLWLERRVCCGIANSVVIDIDCNVLIDARVQIVAPRDVKQGDFDGDGAEDDYRYVIEYAFSNYRVVQPRIVLTIDDYNGDLVIDHAEVVRK